MLGPRCVSSEDKGNGNVVDSDMKPIHDPKIYLYASYILHMVCTWVLYLAYGPVSLKV